MMKYIRYIFCLACFLITGTLISGTPGSDEITEQAFKLLKETIEQNRLNDLNGYSYRNNYVIEINLDEKWIEERGSGVKVFASKYESISGRLNEFNNKRADKLRAYVVVVNDWELRLKQHVNIDMLPSSVKLDALTEQAEANSTAEKNRIRKELDGIPLDVLTKLNAAGYTDMAVCFGANVKFYTVDATGTPAARGYKYSTVVLAGEKLKAYSNEIRSKIVGTPGATLENDVEMKVFSLTDGIEEVVDQQKPLTLAYKVSNPSVNSWYTSIGEKTADPYSGVSTAKQIYDYTGVFSSLKREIINQLPDPTAQVIITDNLTSDEIIENIKSQVEKPLVANVFWFHLDRKGELQTQMFLAETVKKRLEKLPNDVPTGLDQYIGMLYKQAGPKIKSAADLVDFLNIGAHVFQALNFVLDKTTIPRSWWDASSPDYLLGVWGRYISPDTGIAFAYICGVWNGVIGNLSVVSSLLSLTSELQGAFVKLLVEDSYRDQVFSDIKLYTSNIPLLINIAYETVKAKVSQTASEEWEKLKNGDATSVAYVGGLATVEVVITIFTGGTVEAVKAGLMSFKLIRIPVEFIAKFGSYLIHPVVIIYKAGGDIATEGLEYALKQSQQTIARVTADGKLKVYQMLSATEKVVDEIPIPQSVVKMDGDGNAIGDLVFAKTATGWGFKKRSEFLEALSKSLANYPALRDRVLLLTKDLQEKFIDDFLKTPDNNTLKLFNQSVDLVDAWHVLKEANLSNDIRKNILNIQTISKALKQKNYNSAYFKDLLKSKTDPQKFIDDYVSKLDEAGKFADNTLENGYMSYIARKKREGRPPRDRTDWNESRDYWMNDSPMARGNNFNRKAWEEGWYPAWEVQLENGRFMDGYNPFTKEIVSRKATDFIDIDESTFVGYLDELLKKYAPPKKITTKKQGAIYDQLRLNPDLPLDAKLILEVPESNKLFYDLERYISIAKDKGITIHFRPE